MSNNEQPTQTSYEEATRCPRCQHPGQVASKQAAPQALRPGTTVHMIFCRTPGCPWENTNWVVQVNPDGTVPPPQDHRSSAPSIHKPSEEEIERIRQSIRAQGEGEMRGRG